MEPQSATQFSASAIDRLKTAAAVASILGVSPKTVHKLVREGKLACVQVTSRERRFTDEQVQDFIRSHSIPGRVDKKPLGRVSSPVRKGGAERKSAGDFGTDLVKEIRSLCR